MPVPRHCGTAAGAGQCPSCPFHWQAQPALNRGGASALWLNLEQPQPEAAYGAHLPLAGRPSCATMSSLTCYRASGSCHFPFGAVCSLSGTLPEIFLGRSRFSFTSSGHHDLPPSRWSGLRASSTMSLRDHATASPVECHLPQCGSDWLGAATSCVPTGTRNWDLAGPKPESDS
jgi:hypothetical protein